MLELHADVEVVAEAADGAQAAELTLRHESDVVLVDLRMPGVDGLEAIRRVRAGGARSRVLVVTPSSGTPRSIASRMSARVGSLRRVPPVLNLREEVAAASRRLAAEGLVLGTAGNVSARDGDLVAVTPTGAQLAALTAQDVSVVDLAGRQVDGELAPTSELGLHLGVYQRYGAGAVVHTHAPTATALACVLDELPCVHYAMLALGGSVRVAPYRTFGTPELAAVTLDALEGRTAALMANHGAITYGADVAGALDASLLLEWACTVYWRAAALGAPRTLGEDHLAAVVNALVERGYGTTQKAG